MATWQAVITTMTYATCQAQPATRAHLQLAKTGLRARYTCTYSSVHGDTSMHAAENASSCTAAAPAGR